MCPHSPQCPPASARDHLAAKIVSSRPEQCWRLLCNGVVLFDDGGEIFPDGHVTGEHRVPAPRASSRVEA